MHIECPYLDLEWLTGRTNQRGVQGLIHVRLWHRDIIFESTRDRFIDLVDDAQRCVAVLHGIYLDTDRKQVIDLIQ